MSETKCTRLVLQIAWVFDLTLVNTKVKIIQKCYEHVLYHSPIWVHTGSAKEHNWKRKRRENMQSSICRKLANLLTFHRKASKTRIYWFIPVKISAKWLSLRSNNNLQEVESLTKKKQTKCQFNSSMSLLSCSVHHMIQNMIPTNDQKSYLKTRLLHTPSRSRFRYNKKI